MKKLRSPSIQYKVLTRYEKNIKKLFKIINRKTFKHNLKWQKTKTLSMCLV